VLSLISIHVSEDCSCLMSQLIGSCRSDAISINRLGLSLGVPFRSELIIAKRFLSKFDIKVRSEWDDLCDRLRLCNHSANTVADSIATSDSLQK
jgi:hypothetical protein